MFLRNSKQFTKRLISVLLLIHISFIMNKENDKLEFLEVTDLNIEDESTFERIFTNNNEQQVNGFKKNVKMSFFDTDECLYDKSLIADVLKQNGINKTPTTNLRFILGHCNPVVMIPGMYSKRLMMQIDCKKFKENRDNLINMKLFCGESVCKNDYEEHVIWPALFDSPFTLRVNEENKYTSCFGYFFTYQNKKEECPEYKKISKTKKFFGNEEQTKNVCPHDDAVKIVFYGGTENTKNKSQCGLRAIRNIVSAGNTYIPEALINSGAPLAFEKMYERFHQMGYREGFSMAGIPFDFRRFVTTNKEFKKILKSQVERLYKNTNKKVVVVAHSFGCLNALEELIGEDSQFLSKIKKFIAISPPFAGASKAVEILLNGSKEFDTHVHISGFDLMDVELTDFAQKLMSPFFPPIYELKPDPGLFSLFEDDKYSRLKDAISERINLEKECKEIDCDGKEILKKSIKFNTLFTRKGETTPMFPTLSDEVCNLENFKRDPKYLKRIEDFKKATKRVPNFLPCRNDIYDIINCPAVVVKSRGDEEAPETIEKFCLKNNEVEGEPISQKSLFEPSNAFFNFACEKENPQCLDNFISQFSPYPYTDEKMVYLIDRFYKNYKDQFKDIVINTETFFESKEEFIDKIKLMTSYHEKISNKNKLNIPKVDTIIVFGSFLPTKTAFLFDSKKPPSKSENIDTLWKGGDGTVSSWSSLLVGLKWIFDKYNKGKKVYRQNIQLVEYCSILSQTGSKYLYNKSAEIPQEFSVMSCDCFDSDGLYKVKETNANHCDHSNMISDSKVIKLVEENLADENFIITRDIMDAVRNFENNIDFEDECNTDLLRIVKEEN